MKKYKEVINRIFSLNKKNKKKKNKDVILAEKAWKIICKECTKEDGTIIYIP